MIKCSVMILKLRTYQNLGSKKCEIYTKLSLEFKIKLCASSLGIKN